MNHRRKVASLLAAGLMQACLAATMAKADVMILPGPGNIAGDENVLFNEAGLTDSGNPVQGITNNSGVKIDFLGTENLKTPSGGQARIEAQTGTFDNLTISLTPPGGSYRSLIMNLNAVADGLATITANEPNGDVNVLSFNISSNGQNFVRIIASNNQSLSSVNVSSTAQLADIRQIRVGVPEPSTWMLSLAGAAFFGLIVRRRFK